MIDVSVVIVCMNNLNNLYPCLDSIKKYTTNVSYEVFVVAYLFTKENLESLKRDYSWVKIIESNEIRGFSENNNLALKQAKGEYCFVLNDDTEMQMPVLDQLVSDIRNLPNNVAIISPVPILPNGDVQFCGRPPHKWYTYILTTLKCYDEKNTKRFCNKNGIFKSYDIIGAAFLIKTELFEKVRWFNEYYFFSPEDLALSTHLNKLGYECWVDADARIKHYEGMTGKNKRHPSMVQAATMPATAKGLAYFYANETTSGLWYNLFRLWLFVESFIFYLYYGFRSILNKHNKSFSILSIGKKRVLQTIFGNKTPKELFSYYYLKDKSQK